jgi:hypothetical protein
LSITSTSTPLPAPMHNALGRRPENDTTWPMLVERKVPSLASALKEHPRLRRSPILGSHYKYLTYRFKNSRPNLICGTEGSRAPMRRKGSYRGRKLQGRGCGGGSKSVARRRHGRGSMALEEPSHGTQRSLYVSRRWIPLVGK